MTQPPFRPFQPAGDEDPFRLAESNPSSRPNPSDPFDTSHLFKPHHSMLARFNMWLLMKKLTLPECPLSRERNWGITEELVEVRPFSDGGIDLGANVFPAVMLTCRGCGYVMLINAKLAGLV